MHCLICKRDFEYDRAKGHRRNYCNSCLVIKRRREIKKLLVAEHGGECRFCSYSDYVGALDFHHVDPSAKSFGVSQRGFSRSLDRARAESKKCVLCCKNCHAEIEGGLIPYDVVLDVYERSNVDQLADQHPVKVTVEGSSPSIGAILPNC